MSASTTDVTVSASTSEVTVSASTSAEKKMIEIRSSDGEIFQMEEKVAALSVTINNIIEDGCGDSVIPIPNVTAVVLAKAVEYCKRYADVKVDGDKDEELKAFDAEFVKVEQEMLFDMILAANYLNIKGMLDLTCQTVADMMKGKTVDEIRTTFNIVNDYTPEEEAEVRKENAWAFD